MFLAGKSPPAGFEPATYRLTAERSANWAKEEYIAISNDIVYNIIVYEYKRNIIKCCIRDLNPGPQD